MVIPSTAVDDDPPGPGVSPTGHDTFQLSLISRNFPFILYVPRRVLALRSCTGYNIQRAREDVTLSPILVFVQVDFDRLALAERSQSIGRISLLEGAETNITRGPLLSLL